MRAMTTAPVEEAALPPFSNTPSASWRREQLGQAIPGRPHRHSHPLETSLRRGAGLVDADGGWLVGQTANTRFVWLIGGNRQGSDVARELASPSRRGRLGLERARPRARSAHPSPGGGTRST